MLPRNTDTDIGNEMGVTGPSARHSAPVDIANNVAVQVHRGIVTEPDLNGGQDDATECFNVTLRDIFNEVIATGKYNFAAARRRIPSGLKANTWRHFLEDYSDKHITDYLEFGWPINHDRVTPLQATLVNHPSATNYSADIEHYIAVERANRALAGPFQGPPTSPFHISPLMTKPKRDSRYRRVIMDLSWPKGAAVNDGIDAKQYIDGPMEVTLPTADYMADRILQLGPGAWLYKTDLARGYRQLRVDPWDWTLLGFMNGGQSYMDICPPFGLRSSAMFMQRTSQAICHIHARRGFLSRAYLDDFGGAEASKQQATTALTTLQDIMRALGVAEAKHKVCPPAQRMVWLGIYYDTVDMKMSIPSAKLAEIMDIVHEWGTRTRATRKQVQSLLGLLQFVASVSPPVRVFTNRMLTNLRDMPDRGGDTLSLGFKSDLTFFQRLLPSYNGIRVLDKEDITYQGRLELDACLTGCGATTGDQYYSEVFPEYVLRAQHPIAHLELLNVIVAAKTWQDQWSGTRVLVLCDNTNACLAIQTGRSRDLFVQACIRELFYLPDSRDIELRAQHCPGRDMGRADALSRMHLGERYRRIVREDTVLRGAQRVIVPPATFRITFDP